MLSTWVIAKHDLDVEAEDQYITAITAGPFHSVRERRMVPAIVGAQTTQCGGSHYAFSTVHYLQLVDGTRPTPLPLVNQS